MDMGWLTLYVITLVTAAVAVVAVAVFGFMLPRALPMALTEPLQTPRHKYAT